MQQLNWAAGVGFAGRQVFKQRREDADVRQNYPNIDYVQD